MPGNILAVITKTDYQTSLRLIVVEFNLTADEVYFERTEQVETRT